MKCTAILAGSRLPTAHSRIILHRGNTQAGFFQRDLPATARPHLRLGSAWQPPKTRFNYSDRRGYADAATTTSATPARRPGKPKAHSSTGPKTPRARTTAGSKSSATPGRTSAVTKADRVKRVAKTGGAKSKKPGPKPKPKKKKKKATPKKKKAIPKKKTVPKRKVLTPQQKRRLEVQQLKKVGFVHREEYDRKPSSILAIVSHDHKGQNKGLSGAQGEGMTTAQQIKALSPSERERITHLAQRNARHNQQALAHWITTKTAPEILAANNARRLLKRKYEVKHGVTPLVDPRKPKRGLTAYFQYLNASFADRPEGEPIIAHARRIGRLWATMPAAEKKPYEDMAHRDAERYNAEYTAVFGPRKVKKVKARSMGVQTE